MGIDCGICYEKLGDDREIIATKCGHLYHKVCIMEWLQRSLSCPECRQPVRKGELIAIFMNNNQTIVERKKLPTKQIDYQILKKQNAELTVQLKESKDRTRRYRDLNLSLLSNKEIARGQIESLKTEIAKMKEKASKQNKEFAQLHSIMERHLKLQAEFKRIKRVSSFGQISPIGPAYT